jgi:hypothetical protein
MPSDAIRCKYSSFRAFLLALDILVTSGVAVDTEHDDFDSYYELFALGEFDKWYSAQIVSAGGSDQGIRCEFGISHLPDALNRANFMMCDLVHRCLGSCKTIATRETLTLPAPTRQRGKHHRGHIRKQCQ